MLGIKSILTIQLILNEKLSALIHFQGNPLKSFIIPDHVTINGINKPRQRYNNKTLLI